MTRRFERKRVVVTGASSGIGRATALAFVAEGATVVALARRRDLLSELEAEVSGNIKPVAVDVRDRVALRAAIAATAELGAIDVLVNNAGVAFREPILEVSDEHWDATLETNLTSAFVAAQDAARHMVARGGGAIVNVASVDAFVAESPFGAYSASKAGLVMLTRCLAFELGHLGVRCNAVCPGMTVTEMTEKDLGGAFEYEYYRRLPQRRFATPDEQAKAILFLASGDASYINGTTLEVDGGLRSGFWYAAEHEPPLGLASDASGGS